MKELPFSQIREKPTIHPRGQLTIASVSSGYSGVDEIFVNTGAFPGSNLIATVESGNHLACDLGARCLAATSCKASASSLGGQEQSNFGPIGPPYGSIIRAMASLCGMASKNLEMYRTFAL